MTPWSLVAAVMQSIINDGLSLLMLLVIVVAGMQKAWVLGRELRTAEKRLTDERVDFMRQLNEMREERNEWRAAALYGGVQPKAEGGHPHESRLGPEP